MKRRLERDKDVIKGYDKRVEESKQGIDKLKSNIIEHQTRYSELEKQFEELLNETSDTEYSLRETIKILENAIINLKAKLYDKTLDKGERHGKKKLHE